MNDKAKTYYIGDIARELGLSQRTIRYYEELGIIKPPRTVGGFRTYSEQNVEILRMVVRFKELGVPLEDIRAMIAPGAGQSLGVDAVRRLREGLLARRKEFEAKLSKYSDGIKQIEEVLGILGNCANCGCVVEEGICETCLKHRGGDESPLIHPLIHHGEN